MGEFNCFGTIVTVQICIHEDIKSCLSSEYACYHSDLNLLSSCLLYKNLNIKICRKFNFIFVLYGCETWSVTLREEHRLRMCVGRGY